MSSSHSYGGKASSVLVGRKRIIEGGRAERRLGKGRVEERLREDGRISTSQFNVA